MKKLICLHILTLMCVICHAQSISVARFEAMPTDLTANLQGTTVLDQNGEPCALIKIKTTRTGFTFDVGVLGVTKTEHKPGYVWVYVPHGIKRIEIAHEQQGAVTYNFDIPIQKACTYNLELVCETVPTTTHVARVKEDVKPDSIIIKQGSCGTNVKYELYSNGTLHVFGTGKMNDYGYSDSPFYKISSEVKKVIIDNEVTTIGKHAFCSCLSLTTITIGNSVTNIRENAFYSCESLTSVTIGNSVISIEDHAFRGCKSLPSIIIPNSVTNIGRNAFYSCESLTSVTIGNGVTSIGYQTFGDCKSLSSVTFGNSLTNIGHYAFGVCKSLSSVVIPNTVISIGDLAYFDCSSLTSVYIPYSVTDIGFRAFDNCPNARFSIEYNGNNFENISKKQITSIIIPKDVRNIKDDAFWECKSLTSVTAPKHLKSKLKKALPYQYNGKIVYTK